MAKTRARSLHARSRIRQGRQRRQRHLDPPEKDGGPVGHRLQRRTGSRIPRRQRPAPEPAPGPYQLQACGRFPGAGAQLGIHFPGNQPPGPYPQGQRPPRPQSAEPVRLHGRRLPRRQMRRGRRHPPRLRAPGRHLGPRKHGAQRPGRHPLGGGRRPEIRQAGSQARQQVRRHHPGPARIRPRPRR